MRTPTLRDTQSVEQSSKISTRRTPVCMLFSSNEKHAELLEGWDVRNDSHNGPSIFRRVLEESNKNPLHGDLGGELSSRPAAGQHERTRLPIPESKRQFYFVDEQQLSIFEIVKLSDYRREGSAPRPGQVSLSNRSTTASMSLEAEILSCTRCQAEFAVGTGETSDQLKFGETYKLTGSWTESSGFHVEDGITVKVPNLPIITNMKIEFSNTLHTVCFVILCGTGLIVGESLNVTLNSSHSLIATVTSGIETKTTELQIG
ncbi:hypothetical protein BLNAU_9849 [Blattamonas nauphoetae]|uniref:Uncharacterized protein n=1 Tax=Blattamonas nauphoetae TaxID=2049346 RepID=A0ABQ9XUG3_9EUKA|nr:hypothetical protein BLNAU_9849 [Blattamonas nauphoetae]